ncbi:hypothetical protein N0V84_004760 [Fusarium piperis]|uniref:DUF7732 domain-containing protein n=1 Tax=Fusarium piperis TaxID=1435070 RepID=A0A9W8WEW8_9HYPO|nr:hypothetical protein N0V84_004760 [Fusarium piperis]
MRFDLTFLYLTLVTSAAASVVDPPRRIKRIESEPSVNEHELFKRRGGGGGGGRGGGGGGGRSSSGGSRGGSSSSGGRSGSSSGGSSTSGSGSGSSRSGGSSSGSGSSSSRSGNSRSSYRSGSSSSFRNVGGSSRTSNAGGGSRGGSGPQPNFARGRYYPGGAAAPYRSGNRSPAAGILPFVLIGSALAFWPGVWLYGAYMYPYTHQYHFHNDTSDEDEVRDVICGCGRYEVCGCDDNNDTAYYDQLIGNGSWEALNKSIVTVAEYRGNMTILINGTLPNGTTVPEQDSPAGLGMRGMIEALGYWPAVAAVAATVFLV